MNPIQCSKPARKLTKRFCRCRSAVRLAQHHHEQRPGDARRRSNPSSRDEHWKLLPTPKIFWWQQGKQPPGAWNHEVLFPHSTATQCQHSSYSSLQPSCWIASQVTESMFLQALPQARTMQAGGFFLFMFETKQKIWCQNSKRLSIIMKTLTEIQ